jgi:hypothetical protein
MESLKTKLPITYENIYDDLRFMIILYSLVSILNFVFISFLNKLNIEHTNYYIFGSFFLIGSVFLLKYSFYKNNADAFCKQLFKNLTANNDKLEIQMITKIKITSGRGSSYGEIENFFIEVKHNDITFEISCNRRFDRIKIQKELLSFFKESVCLPPKRLIVYY